MIGLHRLDIDPNNIGTIVISHLHGDHYSGLIWLIMHAQHVSDRSTPLVIIGPHGTKERYLATAELLFPGSTRIEPKFSIEFFGVSKDGPEDN